MKVADTPTTDTTAATPTATPTTAAKKAKAWKQRGYLSHKDVSKWFKQKQASGSKNPNVHQFLEKQLSKGIGVSAGVVNKFNQGEYQTARSFLMRQIGEGNAIFNKMYPQTPNVGGMRGLKMQQGQIYMGAQQVKTPRIVEIQNASGASGHTVTPGKTDYARSIVSKNLLREIRKPMSSQPLQSEGTK